MDEFWWDELRRAIGEVIFDSQAVEFPRRFDALRPLINENPRAIFTTEDDPKDSSSNVRVIFVGERHLFQVRIGRKAQDLGVVRRHLLTAIDEVKLKTSRGGDTTLTCQVGDQTILKRQASTANINQLRDLAKALTEAIR